METSNLIRILEKSEIFKGLRQDQILHLLNFLDTEIKEYKKGAIIFSEGEECMHLSIVLDGIVEVQNLFPSGKVVRYVELGPPNVFGEALIFGTDSSYPTDIGAFTDVKIMMIRKEKLSIGLTNHHVLLSNYMRLLSDKMRLLNGKIKLLAQDSVSKKVAMHILRLSDRQSTDRVICRMTREQLAEHLALPRPSLSRELVRLRNEGIIDFEKDYFDILDRDALEEILFD